MKTNKEIDDERSDFKNWKWGVFYYNKDDKELFPPKGNKKFGSTINFANPRSVFYFTVFVILILIPVILIFIKK